MLESVKNHVKSYFSTATWEKPAHLESKSFFRQFASWHASKENKKENVIQLKKSLFQCMDPFQVHVFLLVI